MHGCTFKLARKEAGLTVEEAAFRIHVSPRALSNYESGQRVPPPDVVAGMAREYKRPDLIREYCGECPIGQAFCDKCQKSKEGRVAA